VKLIRPFLVIALLVACASSAGSAFAGSGCPDDPERCVERGASMTHRSVAVAPATAATASNAPARVAPATASASATRKAVSAPSSSHKASNKARVAPTTPPATPGMGMLLKLSNGTGGEVSLFPSKPTDTTGASWVL